MKTMTSREANQDFSRAKRAAEDGPVLITDRGRPSRVLLTYDEYRRLSGETKNILETLAAPETAHVDLDLPTRAIEPIGDYDPA